MTDKLVEYIILCVSTKMQLKKVTNKFFMNFSSNATVIKIKIF